MAKILVTPELMASVLFPNLRGVNITAASFVHTETCGTAIELDLQGADVPDAERVMAYCRRQPEVVVTFEALPPK